MYETLNYVIGKNAADNTNLVRTSYDMDIWFHIKGVSSAHLILRNPDETDLNTLRRQGIIYRMALALKNSSKYRRYNNIAVIYDYCKNIILQDKPGLVSVNHPRTMKV